MDKKLNGVNLGGWLVLEKWMTPSLFAETDADDEHYLAYDLPEKEYKAYIKTHRASFITEADFLRIAQEGFNIVRIPVPYFVFGDREPFIGCIEELDRAFAWAKHYGLDILIDLHTVPLSQNGFDNGGLSGVCRWAQTPSEVTFVLSVLKRLADRYKHHRALWGIEVINEPITENMWKTMNPLERFPARDDSLSKGSAPITFDFLEAFYLEAYQELRAILPADKVIVFHDGFELNRWKHFFKKNKLNNIMLDTHQYLMFAELTGTDQHVDKYVEYLRDLGKQIEDVQQYVPVFVGEWSLFNSYATGADTKGGINPTQQAFQTQNKHDKAELKKLYNTLWDESMTAWCKGSGHMYWTYKLNIDTVNEPSWYGWDSWDMSRCLSQEWINLKDW